MKPIALALGIVAVAIFAAAAVLGPRVWHSNTVLEIVACCFAWALLALALRKGGNH